ncbi:hypothetical protein OEZ86_004287 [Tetradesmus obliquus]|nr:hypothetical protein OEZ86_004287 [Tetradesmus obliquus]
MMRRLCPQQFALPSSSSRAGPKRSAFSALQSEVKAAKAELKLAEQTAGIATRDHNELWGSFQQLRQELSEAQARLVELEQAKEQLQQQKDETAAAGTRVDTLRGELAVSVEELQQLQEQVKMLSGFLNIVGQAAGETGSRMDKFKRQKTGNPRKFKESGRNRKLSTEQLNCVASA